MEHRVIVIFIDIFQKLHIAFAYTVHTIFRVWFYI